MLDIKTVTTGADLAAVLNTQGIQVSPVGGSPLAKLNQTLLGAGLGDLTGVVGTTKEDMKNFDAGWAAMMVSHSRTSLPDGSDTEYQAFMQVLAEEIGASVKGTIDFARNVVNPIIKDICEKISLSLEEAGKGGTIARTASGQRFVMSNSTLVVNILEEGPEPLYLDGVVDTETSARLKIPYQNVRSPVMYPQMTSAELLDFVEKNGKGELAKDVIETLKSRDDGIDQLLQVYNNTYAFIPGRVTGIDIRAITSDMTITPLIVLVLANALYEDLPEGTSGSANTINTAMSAWIAQVKNIIEVNVEMYKQSLKDKSIVLTSFNENFEINVVVNKENYHSYLNDGGTTEALLGSVFTDKDYDYDNLLTNQPEYESAYERRVSEAASFNEANRLTIFKNCLREQIKDHIFNCDEDAIRPVAAPEAREALDGIMKTIFVDALDNPYECVRRVVCNTLFLGTDAEEILVNIDNVCDKNEKLTVRDAGALVVLDYLTKFMVSQMAVARTS